MTDKTDGPAKDGGRGSDVPGVKRPHATIDVKATEVTPPQAAKPAGEAAPAAAQSAAATSASPSAAKPAEQKAADQPKSGSATKPAAGDAAAAKPGTAAAAAPVPTRGSGIGRFFSHLAAGLLGGGIVYAGAAYLPDQTLPYSRSAEMAAGLEARIRVLEGSKGDANAQASKLAVAESRLAKLEGLEQSVAALSETNRRLEQQSKSMGEKVAGDTASAEQLAKLEERLNIIAKGSEAGDGRVPQLAAVTGKISDLETTIANQIGALRKSIPADLEGRLAAAAEAAEAAKAGAQRVDRELAQQRTETAKLAQRGEAVKADADRLAASVEAAKEETGKLTSAVGELRSAMAKLADVSAAVSPVASKVATLEQTLQSVVKSEDDRKANAERIVLALELANLKRALDRGQGYAAELAEVRKAAQGRIDLAPLERYKDAGVPSQAALDAEFRPVMHAVIDADSDPGDGSLVDRFLSGARSIVRVRKVSHDAGDTSAEAVTSRMEEALKAGQLGTVLEQAKTLPQRATAPVQDWLQKVQARNAVDRAMAAIEGPPKASLAGTPSPAGQGDTPAPNKN
ncbi:MAG: hypothetical protein WC807_03400 [Hyphomicrobium sp.]|jgi:hypothetical protein